MPFTRLASASRNWPARPTKRDSPRGSRENWIRQLPADLVNYRGMVGLAVVSTPPVTFRALVAILETSSFSLRREGQHAPVRRADKTVTGSRHSRYASRHSSGRVPPRHSEQADRSFLGRPPRRTGHTAADPAACRRSKSRWQECRVPGRLGIVVRAIVARCSVDASVFQDRRCTVLAAIGQLSRASSPVDAPVTPRRSCLRLAAAPTSAVRVPCDGLPCGGGAGSSVACPALGATATSC